MNKIIPLLLNLVCMVYAVQTRAQSYLDSTSTWYEYFGGSNGITYYKDYNTYFFDGDTVISGKSYYKLYWNQVDSVWITFTQSFDHVDYNNHIYQGALREDSLKRFYICYPSQASESLLFDFNLSGGSSLPDMIANYGCNVPPLTVASVDSAYLGTTMIKEFHVGQGVFAKTLYEGIGCSGGFIWSGSLCLLIESGGCLIAYKKGLDSLYINCGLGSIGIEEQEKQEVIRIFPNPASGFFTIAFSNPLGNGTLTVYDVVGNKLVEELIKTTEQKEVHLKNPVPGIYFVKVEGAGKSYCRKLIIE